jgi:hypothetical protein
VAAGHWAEHVLGVQAHLRGDVGEHRGLEVEPGPVDGVSAARHRDALGYGDVSTGYRSLASNAERCLGDRFDEADLRDLAYFTVSLPDWLHPKIAAYAFRPETWQERAGRLVEEVNATRLALRAVGTY